MKEICVCNALNTAEYDTIEGMSCIDYWIEKTRGLWIFCPACKSLIQPSNPMVGGHVIDFLSPSPHVFITPIHDKCNKQREKLPYFKVSEIDLVPIPEEDAQTILSDPDNIEQIQRMQQAYRESLQQELDRLQ